MILNHFFISAFLKQNEMAPIGSKHIIRAMILDDFESVLEFLHFSKQNEIAPISSKYIVRTMVFDGFEPVLSFLQFFKQHEIAPISSKWEKIIY